MSERRRPPGERRAVTTKLTVMAGRYEQRVYLTTGYYETGELCEVFIRVPGASAAVYDALAVAISMGLQHGVPWGDFARHMEFQGPGVRRPAADDAGEWSKKVRSILDLVAKWVNDHQRLEDS
jgi:hypothetical protein